MCTLVTRNNDFVNRAISSVNFDEKVHVLIRFDDGGTLQTTRVLDVYSYGNFVYFETRNSLYCIDWPSSDESDAVAAEEVVRDVHGMIRVRNSRRYDAYCEGQSADTPSLGMLIHAKISEGLPCCTDYSYSGYFDQEW